MKVYQNPQVKPQNLLNSYISNPKFSSIGPMKSQESLIANNYMNRQLANKSNHKLKNRITPNGIESDEDDLRLNNNQEMRPAGIKVKYGRMDNYDHFFRKKVDRNGSPYNQN